MNEKLKIVLILVTASVLLTIATVASASYTYTEETIMLNMEEVQCTSIYHWTGKDAEDKAMRIDNDYFSKSGPLSKPDRHCQCNELERYMKEEYEKPEKEKDETDDVFIDGIRGNIIDVDCDAKCTGYVEVTKDATITCTTTTKWNLEDKNEHVYSRAGLKDSNAISFTVPEGWTISSVEDLKGSSISSDKRTVRGLAITDETYVIRFTKALVPTPSPSPSPSLTSIPSPTPMPIITPSPSATPTLIPTPTPPGFEAIFTIAGLLAVAYLLRRE